MLSGAGEGSDYCVSPTASQSKENSVTLQNEGKASSSLQKGARVTCWGLKHFQWYLITLAVLVLVVISLASSYIDGVGRNTESILDVLDVQASTVSRVMTGVRWVIAGTWALAGTTMLATVFAAINKFYIVWRRERFDQNAASGSLTMSRSWWGCFGFNFSRVLLNVVHVCVLLTAIWFIVLLCAAVACVTLFYFVDEATTRAIGTIQDTEDDTNAFADNITEWLEKHSDDLASLTTTVNAFCAVSACPPSLQQSLSTLNDLDAEVARVALEVSAAEAVVCPSNACINLDQMWFLEASGCVCASDTVRRVRDHASDAASNSFWASIFVAIALLATLLMISKTAMNLKSLLKNERWIKRMRKVFAKLASRGVLMGAEDSAFLHTDSSASRFQDLVYAALPSGALPLPPVSTSSRSGSGDGASGPRAAARWRHAAAAAMRRLPSGRLGSRRGSAVAAAAAAAVASTPRRPSAELVAVELAAATGDERWDALQSIAGEELPLLQRQARTPRALPHALQNPPSPHTTPSLTHPADRDADGDVVPGTLPTASTFTLDRSSNESSPGSGDHNPHASDDGPASMHASLRVLSDSGTAIASSGAPPDWNARLSAASAAVDSSSSSSSSRPPVLEPRNTASDRGHTLFPPSISEDNEAGPAAVSAFGSVVLHDLAPPATQDSAFTITPTDPAALRAAALAHSPLAQPPTFERPPALAQHAARPPVHPGISAPLVGSSLRMHSAGAAGAPLAPPMSRNSSGFVTAASGGPSDDISDASGSSSAFGDAAMAGGASGGVHSSSGSSSGGGGGGGDGGAQSSGNAELSSGLSVRQSGPLPLTPALNYYDSSSSTIPTGTCDSMSPEIPFLLPLAGGGALTDAAQHAQQAHVLFDDTLHEDDSPTWSGEVSR
eukprot:jgi/Ulvmu1/11326/UM074_0041.1